MQSDIPPEEITAVEPESVTSAASPSVPVPANQMLRLHPTSLLFELLAQTSRIFFPIVLGIFGATKNDWTLIIFSGTLFVPSLLTSIIRYFTYRYFIHDQHLYVREGLIFRQARTVPVKRIQNIDLVQNLLHRILGVAEVKVETASGTKPEAVLRVLSLKELEYLRQSVFSIREQTEPTPSSEENAFANSNLVTNTAQPLLRIPSWWLIQGGLASNRGLIMAAIIVGSYTQMQQNWEQDFQQVFQFLPELSRNGTIVAISGGALALALLLRLLGVGWYLLRFHGYQLVRNGEDLQVSGGLLTRVSATVPRARIQFISVHENWIMRQLKLASIRIETAGGAATQGEDARETISKRWFVPVIATSQVPALLAELRPDLDWAPDQLEYQGLHRHAGSRFSRVAIFQALGITVAGALTYLFANWTFWLCFLGIALLPFLLWWANKKSRAMRYARLKDGVLYRSGVFVRKTSATFFDKIQNVTFEQTPFDRRWGMATLGIDTAAAGPADHAFDISFLDQAFVKSELDWIKHKL